MRLMALIVPWLAFVLMGRLWAGLGSLILQLTLVGWPFASLWALRTTDQRDTDQRLQQAFAERDPSDPMSGPWTRRSRQPNQ